MLTCGSLVMFSSRYQTTAILEEYTILWNQKLGAGISGPVRPCVRKETGGRFALKMLLDCPKSRNEVKVHLMCCSHPHVVQLHHVYANTLQLPHESMARARLLIVMEMMEGGELFHRISQCRHFTEKQASQVAKQVALALQHCHSLNVAHRDLKPENLLFKDNTLDAPLKLCDFGFAKVDQGDLMTPQFTPYYAAPQVLEAQKRHRKEKAGIIPTSPTPYTYNKSCDLWSMGVIIYVMLCGYPPFHSEQHGHCVPKDMRRKIMLGRFDFPEEEWGQISELAKDIVRKLLRVKPEERLTVDEVLAHPWLNSLEAMDNVLPSSNFLMDKVAMAELQQVHAEQLASMRMPECRVTLKPLTSANNPILRKRKMFRTELCTGCQNDAMEQLSKGDCCPRDITANDNIQCLSRLACHSQSAEDQAVGKLRDVIAQCILPQQDEEVEEWKLCQAMHEAWICCHHQHLLQNALQSIGWNGSFFEERVDRLRLAELLRHFIEEEEKHQ
uniref:non-specific serine/threonine protein kinase n=1 Tax=Eptatretus burgeri TaxID=7764 RepID=A0A8C4N2R0_EPTBU